MIHHLKLHFVSPSTFTTEQITAQYDYLLVFTSILIAIFASYISFLLSARIKSSQLKNEAVIWTFLSSCFLGVGIWAMHFVGMLAYKLPVEVNYDLTITLYSILPSVFASYIVISTDLGRAKSLLLRSLLMAAGIGSMHFYGMMAMIMPAHMTYEPWLFSLSILVAAVLSGLALKINDLRQTRTAISLHANLLSALVMGCAISGMHYIGMISMYVFESNQTVYIPANSNPELAQVIILVLIVLSLLLVGIMELRARSLLSAKLKAVLNTVQDAVISFDHQGNIEFANPATVAMFGYTLEELIGKNITLLIPKTHREFHSLFSHKQIKIKQTELLGKSRLLQGCKKNGSNFPITLSLSPIDNNVNGAFVATIKDLTDIQNQEAFTQTIFDTLPNILIVKEAQELSITHVNKAAETLLGKNKEALIGLKDAELFVSKEATLFSEADRAALSSDQCVTINDEPITINGKTHYLRTRKIAIKDNNNEAKFLLAVSEDITELRAAKVELENLHQRMSMAANAAHMGVWEWNFKSNQLIWDDWMFKLYGINKEDFSGNYSSWSKVIHPGDYEAISTNLTRAIMCQEDFHAEFRVILPNGEVRYLNADGRIYGDKLIGINFDISDRVIAKNKILELAQTDYLTGLANRSSLVKFAKSEFKNAKLKGYQIGCLYFDLDNFKPINDTYGHYIGDKVLVEIANRLKATAREKDCVARMGGDEFVVMYIQTRISQTQIENTLDRFIHAIEQPIITEQGDFLISASIGYALFPDEASDLDQLLTKADAKMYTHKRTKSQNDSDYIN